MIGSWQGALDFLYGLANWETRPPGTNLTFELDRTRRLLAGLGDPQSAWPAVHLAGTNGKGSTAALVASALTAAGYRTGLYTSPHLHTVRERIQVNGAPIPESEVLDWLGRHELLYRSEPGLTTFEALTAMAFSVFAERRVDIAVVEVGLGGRLDTTNVVEPVVSVITPVGLDHTEVLGDTVAKIAADKAGILREGVPAVFAPQTADALAVLERRARDLEIPVVRVGPDVEVTGSLQLPDGQRVRIDWRERAAHYDLTIGLLGPHQRTNAATALAVCELLAEAGWCLTETTTAEGMAATRWPGRFEVLASAPVLVVDGAHNPAAAEALVATMDERLGARRRLLVFGASRDKDVDGVLARLLGGSSWIVVTRSEHPRAMDVGQLQYAVMRHVRPAGGTTVLTADTAAAALDLALGAAGPDDAVVATGSLFLVADVREAFAARGGMPMPPRDPPPAARPAARGAGQ